ncbi:MAG: family 16 glycosylhydrolase, partial [Thermoguttaceae bacterium]|nr:family 16 glycosylhydrolase [Thermoguttaceae bacterium]
SSRPFAPSRLFVRRFAVGALLFVGAVCSPSSALFAETPVCPLGDAFEFAPELSDEFDGAALDAEKWFDFNPAWRGRKPALFSRQNVAVADGTLRLTASLMKPEEVDVENKVRGYDKYWKAIVKSREKIAYGYFEARCQAMRANVCNAFWLYDPHSDRPDVKYVEGEFSEEIDVLEVFGKPSEPSAQNVVWGTLHRYATPYLESIVNKKKDKLANKGFKFKAPFDPAADFHRYAVAWTPTEIRWFVDGEEVFVRENDFFHRPLHVVFDCEIMFDWMGEPDPADLPATFNVDYVRVWRVKDVKNANDAATSDANATAER